MKVVIPHIFRIVFAFILISAICELACAEPSQTIDLKSEVLSLSADLDRIAAENVENLSNEDLKKALNAVLAYHAFNQFAATPNDNYGLQALMSAGLAANTTSLWRRLALEVGRRNSDCSHCIIRLLSDLEPPAKNIQALYVSRQFGGLTGRGIRDQILFTSADFLQPFLPTLETGRRTMAATVAQTLDDRASTDAEKSAALSLIPHLGRAARDSINAVDRLGRILIQARNATPFGILTALGTAEELDSARYISMLTEAIIFAEDRVLTGRNGSAEWLAVLTLAIALDLLPASGGPPSLSQRDLTDEERLRFTRIALSSPSPILSFLGRIGMFWRHQASAEDVRREAARLTLAFARLLRLPAAESLGGGAEVRPSRLSENIASFILGIQSPVHRRNLGAAGILISPIINTVAPGFSISFLRALFGLSPEDSSSGYEYVANGRMARAWLTDASDEQVQTFIDLVVPFAQSISESNACANATASAAIVGLVQSQPERFQPQSRPNRFFATVNAGFMGLLQTLSNRGYLSGAPESDSEDDFEQIKCGQRSLAYVVSVPSGRELPTPLIGLPQRFAMDVRIWADKAIQRSLSRTSRDGTTSSESAQPDETASNWDMQFADILQSLNAEGCETVHQILSAFADFRPPFASIMPVVGREDQYVYLQSAVMITQLSATCGARPKSYLPLIQFFLSGAASSIKRINPYGDGYVIAFFLSATPQDRLFVPPTFPAKISVRRYYTAVDDRSSIPASTLASNIRRMLEERDWESAELAQKVFSSWQAQLMALASESQQEFNSSLETFRLMSKSLDSELNERLWARVRVWILSNKTIAILLVFAMSLSAISFILFVFAPVSFVKMHVFIESKAAESLLNDARALNQTLGLGLEAAMSILLRLPTLRPFIHWKWTARRLCNRWLERAYPSLYPILDRALNAIQRPLVSNVRPMRNGFSPSLVLDDKAQDISLDNIDFIELFSAKRQILVLDGAGGGGKTWLAAVIGKRLLAGPGSTSISNSGGVRRRLTNSKFLAIPVDITRLSGSGSSSLRGAYLQMFADEVTKYDPDGSSMVRSPWWLGVLAKNGNLVGIVDGLSEMINLHRSTLPALTREMDIGHFLITTRPTFEAERVLQAVGNTFRAHVKPLKDGTEFQLLNWLANASSFELPVNAEVNLANFKRLWRNGLPPIVIALYIADLVRVGFQNVPEAGRGTVLVSIFGRYMEFYANSSIQERGILNRRLIVIWGSGLAAVRNSGLSEKFFAPTVIEVVQALDKSFGPDDIKYHIDGLLESGMLRAIPGDGASLSFVIDSLGEAASVLGMRYCAATGGDWRRLIPENIQSASSLRYLIDELEAELPDLIRSSAG